jgi:hypothetical protein
MSSLSTTDFRLSARRFLFKGTHGMCAPRWVTLAESDFALNDTG